MRSKAVTLILAASLTAAAASKASKPAPKRTTATQSYDDDGSDDRSTPAKSGAQATLDTTDLAEFSAQSPMAQKFINGALHLTKCRLTYRFGSADPANGGMDCSGTIHFLLRYMGLKNPPRDASSIYLWTQYHGTLRECSATDLNDPQLRGLRPGDLLFWEGTYDVNRNPPISHAMVYLGREKSTGAPVMAGASDGRRYRGVKRNGVSVFDFTLPKPGSRARFVGYARVPGL
jgi:cell wall-associated NlpC family hydrolase